jgi:hypothetical protein
VTSYEKVYESMIRSDTPEIQVDKLTIIDQILNTNRKGIFTMDHSSVNLIKDRIAKQPIPVSQRYDPKSIS